MSGDHPVRDPGLVRVPDEEQAKHETRAQNVAHDHDCAPGEPIRDDSRGRTRQEHRHEPGQERESDRLAFSGQLQEQREQRHHVEPVAQLRHRVRCVQCAEIPVVPQNAGEASK